MLTLSQRDCRDIGLELSEPKYNAHALELIEGMIDGLGVTQFAELCSQVADLKACHVSENWQDKGLARKWSKLSDKFDQLGLWAKTVNAFAR